MLYKGGLVKRQIRPPFSKFIFSMFETAGGTTNQATEDNHHYRATSEKNIISVTWVTYVHNTLNDIGTLVKYC